jgi:hypothetical protein
VRILIAMATVLALVVGRGPRSDATRLEVEPKTTGVAKRVRLLADLPAFYKDRLFVRDGASHKELKGSDVASVFALFR